MEIEGIKTVNTQIPGTEPVGGADLDKASFLKLLVAQMQHQDPLQPMSNTEFVAQLAQFSSVEQLMSVNRGLEILQVQQMGLANSQAATFIGKEVEVSSDTLDVSGTTTKIGAGFELAGDASDVIVNIKDSSGALVQTINLGPKEKGAAKFEWDCKDQNGKMVPPGKYKIDMTATDEDGQSVNWETRIRGVVEGIVYEKGYPELVIGSIRAELSDIRAVYSNDDTQEPLQSAVAGK